jgi:hypothetical protein
VGALYDVDSFESCRPSYSHHPCAHGQQLVQVPDLFRHPGEPDVDAIGRLQARHVFQCQRLLFQVTCNEGEQFLHSLPPTFKSLLSVKTKPIRTPMVIVRRERMKTWTPKMSRFCLWCGQDKKNLSCTDCHISRHLLSVTHFVRILSSLVSFCSMFCTAGF